MRRALSWSAWLLVLSLNATAADWSLSKLGYPDGPIPDLMFASARPIAPLGDAQLDGILSSEAPLPWVCPICSEHELHYISYEHRKGRSPRRRR